MEFEPPIEAPEGIDDLGQLVGYAASNTLGLHPLIVDRYIAGIANEVNAPTNLGGTIIAARIALQIVASVHKLIAFDIQYNQHGKSYPCKTNLDYALWLSGFRQKLLRTTIG